jgi:hypothetical protein
MAAESGADVHHSTPRCLLGLFDAAAGGLVDWSEFDAAAEHWGSEVRGLSREDLRALIGALPAKSLPPSIAPCTRKLAILCGGAGAEALC